MASQTENIEVLEDGKREPAQLHANMEDGNNGVVVVAQSGSFQFTKTEPTKLQDGEEGDKIEDNEQVTINSVKFAEEDGPASLKSSFEENQGDGKHANTNHGGIVAEVKTGLSTDPGKQHMTSKNNEPREDCEQGNEVQVVNDDCQDSFIQSNGLNVQENDVANNEVEGLSKDDGDVAVVQQDDIQIAIAVSLDLPDPDSQQMNEEISESAPADQAMPGKAEDAGKDIEMAESEEAGTIIIDEKQEEVQSTVQVSDPIIAEALVDASELAESVEGTVAVKSLPGTEQEEPESTVDEKNFNIIIMEETQGEERDSANESTEMNEEEAKVKGAANAEYSCEECGKSFTHLSSKKRHMLKHTEVDSHIYKCLTCAKTFQYNSSLKRHLKLHSDEPTGKAYTCKECSKAFMYATSLKRHLKTHGGKEIYPCPHCQRCFEYISSLKRHEKLHTEGKGFKCDICSKSFGYLSSLTRHHRIHQKTHTCDKCGKEFRLYKSLAKHYVEHGVPLREDELAAMAVEEGEAEDVDVDDGDSNMDVDDANGEDGLKMKEEGGVKGNETLDEDGVRASMAVDNDATESQSNAIDGDVIDLQSAENHPFVKFVVSQNTLTLEQFQSFQQAQGMTSSDGNTDEEVAFAVVQPDGRTVLGENCTMVTEGIQECTGTPVGGIVFVEVDQNNKVTERHMEGLQASNLLQLLQAVEGFATESVVEGEEQKTEESEEKKSTEEEEEAKEEQPEVLVETDKEETVT